VTTRQRVILHVDMDAFYAAIEQRDDPELRGKPVIVGGSRRRGVVSTCSYEARQFGVHSAMPMARALRQCPQAMVVPVRMSAYSEVSRQVMEVLGTFSPTVEPLSLDEAFLDMTGSERLFGPPDAMARSIKDAIVGRTQLTASVGIAKNKFLAKLASDLEKPDGITWVPFGGEAEFIAPLPVRKLWGVGPKAAMRLEALGLHNIGDIAAADRAFLTRHFDESHGAHLLALSQGLDERPVVPRGRRKSVGSEVTLDEDIRGRAAVARVLKRECKTVARALRRAGLVAKGVRVKLRYAETFKLATRQLMLDEPYDESKTLLRAANELLERFELQRPIRLVGIAAFSLVPADLGSADRRGQMDLFADPAEQDSRLEHAVDAIRDRFGDIIGFAD